MYILSPYVYRVFEPGFNKAMVFHTLFGNPRVVNEEGLHFLDLFKQGCNLEEACSLVEGDPEEIANMIAEFAAIHFLVPPDFDERSILLQRKEEQLQKVKNRDTIDHISLSVSDACNFGCEHCLFFQGERDTLSVLRRSSIVMSWEIAKGCIDFYLKLLQEKGENHARIHFGSAEPLLNWPTIEKTLDYCGALIDHFSFEYAINTNLSLLTERMAEILKKHKVRIATSLDGMEEANDTIRITRSGTGTFSTIVERLDLLERIGYPVDGISITVTSRNFRFVDINFIDFVHQRKMKSIAFDYDSINCVDVPFLEIVEKVMRLKSYANQLGIYFDGTWGVPYRKLMARSLLQEPYSFCAAVEGRGLAFSPDGGIRACDYSKEKIGTLVQIDQLFTESSPLHYLVDYRFPGSDKYCEGCRIEGFCGGLCHITREVAGRNPGKLLEKMCNFYRAMTETLIRESLQERR